MPRVSGVLLHTGWTPSELSSPLQYTLSICMSYCYKLTLLPPATKLRQGNVFTPVCHSVHRVGVSATHPWADTPQGRCPSPAQCMLGYTPPHSACWDAVNKRAVRILLECILVCLLLSRKIYIHKDIRVWIMDGSLPFLASINSQTIQITRKQQN